MKRGVTFIEVDELFTLSHLRFVHEGMRSCEHLTVFLKGIEHQEDRNVLISLASQSENLDVRFYNDYPDIKNLIESGSYNIRFVPESEVGTAFVAFELPIRVKFLHDYKNRLGQAKDKIIEKRLMIHASEKLKPYMGSVIDQIGIGESDD